MAGSVPGNYDKFVVVAEDDWKISGKNLYSSKGSLVEFRYWNFCIKFAGFNWDCTYNKYLNPLKIGLLCRDFYKGWTEDVHLELFVCDGDYKAMDDFPLRVILTSNSKFWKKRLQQQSIRKSHFESIIMTIRILKDRSSLPNYTLETHKFGYPKSNCKLRVGDQVFYVNKKLLSAFSRYFDSMFNGNFREAKQDEIELKGEVETENPGLFQDFLLSFPGNCLALPNRRNVAGLLHLAIFYQVDLLKEKCEKFLENCRDMPAWDRLMAAKKCGLKELQLRIVNQMNTVSALKEFVIENIVSE